MTETAKMVPSSNTFFCSKERESCQLHQTGNQALEGQGVSEVTTSEGSPLLFSFLLYLKIRCRHHGYLGDYLQLLSKQIAPNQKKTSTDAGWNVSQRAQQWMCLRMQQIFHIHSASQTLNPIWAAWGSCAIKFLLLEIWDKAWNCTCLTNSWAMQLVFRPYSVKTQHTNSEVTARNAMLKKKFLRLNSSFRKKNDTISEWTLPNGGGSTWNNVSFLPPRGHRDTISPLCFGEQWVLKSMVFSCFQKNLEFLHMHEIIRWYD